MSEAPIVADPQAKSPFVAALSLDNDVKLHSPSATTSPEPPAEVNFALLGQDLKAASPEDSGQESHISVVGTKSMSIAEEMQSAIDKFVDEDWPALRSHYDDVRQKAVQLFNDRSASIKCILTSRTKGEVSIRGTARRRLESRLEHQQSPYKHSSEIIKDMHDLAGLRIALYLPSQVEDVDRLIQQVFSMVESTTAKPNPAIWGRHSGQARYPAGYDADRYFTGYLARHYKIKLRNSDAQDLANVQKLPQTPMQDRKSAMHYQDSRHYLSRIDGEYDQATPIVSSRSERKNPKELLELLTAPKMSQLHLELSNQPEGLDMGNDQLDTSIERLSGTSEDSTGGEDIQPKVHKTLSDVSKLGDALKEIVVEIQVASLMMHAWADVHHDIIYKPVKDEIPGLPNDIRYAESRYLDMINGLAMTSELSLTGLITDINSSKKYFQNVPFTFENVSQITETIKYTFPSIDRGDEFSDLSQEALKLLGRSLEAFEKNTPQKLSSIANDAKQKVEGKVDLKFIDAIIALLEALFRNCKYDHYHQRSYLEQAFVRFKPEHINIVDILTDHKYKHLIELGVSKAAMSILIWIKTRLLKPNDAQRLSTVSNNMNFAEQCLGPDWYSLWMELCPDATPEQPDRVWVALREFSSLEIPSLLNDGVEMDEWADRITEMRPILDDSSQSDAHNLAIALARLSWRVADRHQFDFVGADRYQFAKSLKNRRHPMSPMSLMNFDPDGSVIAILPMIPEVLKLDTWKPAQPHRAEHCTYSGLNLELVILNTKGGLQCSSSRMFLSMTHNRRRSTSKKRPAKQGRQTLRSKLKEMNQRKETEEARKVRQNAHILNYEETIQILERRGLYDQVSVDKHVEKAATVEHTD